MLDDPDTAVIETAVQSLAVPGGTAGAPALWSGKSVPLAGSEYTSQAGSLTRGVWPVGQGDGGCRGGVPTRAGLVAGAAWLDVGSGDGQVTIAIVRRPGAGGSRGA
jgi:hypothetical protein